MSSRCIKVKIFSKVLPSEPPPGLHHEPVTETAMPQDLHLHFTIILWSFSMKCNIWKPNLCSETGISKTAWINAWCDMNKRMYSCWMIVSVSRISICICMFLLKTKEHLKNNFLKLIKMNCVMLLLGSFYYEEKERVTIGKHFWAQKFKVLKNLKVSLVKSRKLQG